MTMILFGIVALTLKTLVQTRAAIGEVTKANEIGELYSDTANQVTLSALLLANYLRTRDPHDLQQLAQSTGKAYEYGELIREKGTGQDKAAMDALAVKNTDAFTLLRTQVATVVSGGQEVRDLASTTVISAVAADVSTLADQKREDALAAATSFERGLRRNFLLTILAFSLGLPLISASYLVTRHYGRLDVVHQAEVAQLQQAALTDSLTGLANHRSFQEDLRREVARAAGSGHRLSVAIIDVDDFKEVNDSHGHANGDLVLGHIAGAISVLRSQGRGYRLGGDEFALIMPDTDANGALDALQRLRASVANGLSGPTISIGVGTSGQDPYRWNMLRDHADAALYEAKHRGKNQVVAYAPELGVGRDLTAEKMQTVRRVVSSGSVSMWFQPIFRIGSSQVLAFEVLLRLPEEPDISGPLEAFAVAEHMGLSRDLDLLCMSKALESAKDLPPDAKLFLNIDPATLVHSDFSAAELLRLVIQHECDPSRIVFEVRERTPAPIARIATQVAALRDCGFSIALDDVGAGNSGLEMLRLIKFEYVKIDRSVILDALNEGPGRAVLLAIAAFAREAGAFMIAEGIETKEMLESIKFDEHDLKQFWVQGVQGFLMGKPGHSIQAFLDAQARRPTQAA